MKNKGKRFWVTAAVFFLSMAVAASGYAQGPNRVDKTSKSSFGETLKKVESALKVEHMMIVAKIDHKNMLSMVGAKINGATTIEFGKPDMGKMLLPMNPAAGLLMPHKIYVYETSDNKVVVSYEKASPAFAAYGPETTKMGDMVDMMLDKVSSEATK